MKLYYLKITTYLKWEGHKGENHTYAVKTDNVIKALEDAGKYGSDLYRIWDTQEWTFKVRYLLPGEWERAKHKCMKFYSKTTEKKLNKKHEEDRNYLQYEFADWYHHIKK